MAGDAERGPPRRRLDENVDLGTLRQPDGSFDATDRDVTAAGLARLLEKVREGGSIDFARARFVDDADFRALRDRTTSSFDHATFERDARFEGVTWASAVFTYARFASWTSFEGATIPAGSFERATFAGDAIFRGATLGAVPFTGAAFEHRADFSGATWTATAEFRDAAFAGPVTFTRATVPDARFVGAVSVGEPSFDGASRFSVVERANIARRPAADEAVGADAAGVRFSWETVIQILQLLGLAAALVLWLVVIGGAVVWARVMAGGLPQPTRTVTLVPQEVFIAQGIRALSWPLLIATVAALVTYLCLSVVVVRQWLWQMRQSGRLTTALLWIVAAAVPAALVWWAITIFSDFRFWYGVVIAATLGLTGALLWLAYRRWPSAGGTAIATFAAILAVSGVVVWVSERGDETPEFERATVLEEGGPDRPGLLFAQDDDRVTLICGRVEEEGVNARLVNVPLGDDARVSVRSAVPLQDGLHGCERVLAGGPASPGDGGGGGEPDRDDPEPRNDPDPDDAEARNDRDPDDAEARNDRDPDDGEPRNDPDPDDAEPANDPDPDDPDPDDPDPDDAGGEGARPPRVSSPARRRVEVSRAGFALVELRPFREPVTGVMQLVTDGRFAKAGWTDRERVKVGTKPFRTGRGARVHVLFRLSGYALARVRDADRDGLRVGLRVTARGMRGAAASDTFPLTLVRDGG